jgi:hypothetical protein
MKKGILRKKSYKGLVLLMRKIFRKDIKPYWVIESKKISLKYKIDDVFNGKEVGYQVIDADRVEIWTFYPERLPDYYWENRQA